MSTRQDVFRAACEQLAFATDSTDPAADLEAVGIALQLRRARSRGPAG